MKPAWFSFELSSYPSSYLEGWGWRGRGGGTSDPEPELAGERRRQGRTPLAGSASGERSGCTPLAGKEQARFLRWARRFGGASAGSWELVAFGAHGQTVSGRPSALLLPTETHAAWSRQVWSGSRNSAWTAGSAREGGELSGILGFGYRRFQRFRVGYPSPAVGARKQRSGFCVGEFSRIWPVQSWPSDSLLLFTSSCPAHCPYRSRPPTFPAPADLALKLLLNAQNWTLVRVPFPCPDVTRWLEQSSFSPLS